MLLGCKTTTNKQTHYPDSDTEPTSPYPTLIMPSAWLGSDNYKFYKSLVWLDPGSDPRFRPREARDLPNRPPCAVCGYRVYILCVYIYISVDIYIYNASGYIYIYIMFLMLCIKRRECDMSWRYLDPDSFIEKRPYGQVSGEQSLLHAINGLIHTYKHIVILLVWFTESSNL